MKKFIAWFGVIFGSLAIIGGLIDTNIMGMLAGILFGGTSLLLLQELNKNAS